MYEPPDPSATRADAGEILKADLPWESLSGKKVLITGGAGMLAAYITETLLFLPERRGVQPLDLTVLVRSEDKARRRFASHLDRPNFHLRTDDICQVPAKQAFLGTSVIIHAASTPRPDTVVPTDVLAPNILGTWNLLRLARDLSGFERFVYFSSGIVNGESIESEAPISEDMYFGSSCTSPGACYSEGKRAGEAICLAFMRQFGVPVDLLRCFGCYGPGLDLRNDPRAFASFIRDALWSDTISMQSAGEETRFWCYATDAIDGFFRILLNPRRGEAWNIANDDAGCTIRELAEMARELSPREGMSIRHTKDLAPAGYSPFKSPRVTVPDTRKLRTLGYCPKISVREGLRRTMVAYPGHREDRDDVG